MPVPENNNQDTLATIVKAMSLLNSGMVIVDGILENEMRLRGLSREEKQAVRKSIIGETRTIADELQSENP